jgi:hypothetical protein
MTGKMSTLLSGATFNLAHSIKQMLYFRPHNKFEEFKTAILWAAAHIPEAVTYIYESGKISAGLIMRMENEERWMANEPVKVGISACLMGDAVRYDGGHKHDRFLTDTLGQYVEYVKVCPEVECGLPVPRESMHLTGDANHPVL